MKFTQDEREVTVNILLDELAENTCKLDAINVTDCEMAKAIAFGTGIVESLVFDTTQLANVLKKLIESDESHPSKKEVLAELDNVLDIAANWERCLEKGSRSDSETVAKLNRLLETEAPDR